ncbi:MAG: hypothetical protein J5I98_23505 [Phaeodactylibacter sp.]|nr:hypothetical protein [Phaeodactylibacter sp.]
MKALTFFPVLFLAILCHSANDARVDEPGKVPKAVRSDNILKPGGSEVLTFTSNPEKGWQTQALWFEEGGSYTLTFSNAGQPHSDHWMVWDCIRLKDGNATVWRIGDCETPPDYSKVAFDEFCDPDNEECPIKFKVGESSNREFPKEINDYSITTITVSFEINPKHARKNLSLELSTLYSTHNNIRDYKLRVALN